MNKEKKIILYGPNGEKLKFKKKEKIEETDFVEYEPIILPKFKELKKNIDKIVWGNEHAKKKLITAMKYLENRIKIPEIEMKKGNVLFFGNTGTGKTFLTKKLFTEAKVPFLELKLTGISAEGYNGESISEIFNQLIKISDEEEEEFSFDEYNLPEFIKNSNYAVIHLDEIDKLATQNQTNFSSELQNELINYIEEKILFEGNLSTKNMLFIGSGAFVGLEEIIMKRLTKRGSIGFNFSQDEKNKEIDNNKIFSYVTHEDLIKYGLKPELVGRFSNLTYTDPLKKKDLISIMDLETSDLNSEIDMIDAAYGVEVILEKEAKEEIADYVSKTKINARGLETAVKKILEPIYETIEDCPVGEKIIIDLNTAKQRLYNN